MNWTRADSIVEGFPFVVLSPISDRLVRTLMDVRTLIPCVEFRPAYVAILRSHFARRVTARNCPRMLLPSCQLPVTHARGGRLLLMDSIIVAHGAITPLSCRFVGRSPNHSLDNVDHLDALGKYRVRPKRLRSWT